MVARACLGAVLRGRDFLYYGEDFLYYGEDFLYYGEDLLYYGEDFLYCVQPRGAGIQKNPPPPR